MLLVCANDIHAASERKESNRSSIGSASTRTGKNARMAIVCKRDDLGYRAFWIAALGYIPDRRAGVTDIYDPRRLDPVLVFQELDASETERRRQRNRIHVELAVPADLAHRRLATIVAAGGRLLDESEGRWRVADPEGNELVIVGGT